MRRDTSKNYSALELARILSKHTRNIQRRAQKEKWPGEIEEGNGGLKYVYPLSSLPADVRRAVAAWELGSTGETAPEGRLEAAPTAAPMGGIQDWLAQPEVEREVAMARLAVLKAQAAYELRQANGQGRLHYIKEFYGKLNQALHRQDAGATTALLELGFRDHEIPGVVARVKRISFQTAYRWQAAFEKSRQEGQGSGVVGLARRYEPGPGLGARTMTPDMVAYVRHLLVTGDVKLLPNPGRGRLEAAPTNHRQDACATPLVKCNRALAYKRLRAQFPQVPSLSLFKRWINQYLTKNGEELAAMILPSWWRANCQPKAGCAAEDVSYAGQRWELDGTPADVMLMDGRHEIIAAVDVWSRDAVMEVEKHASSLTVAKLLRQGILRWGVPETLTTDRGLIFKSKHIQAACSQLGMDLDLCEGYAPWEKPHVEAFFGSMARVLFEMLPWYIGHNVAERRRIEEYSHFSRVFYHRRQKPEKISCEATAAQLRLVLDNWLAKVYRAEEHRFADRTLGRAGTVWQRLAQSPRRAPKVASPEYLDLLLAPGFDKVFSSGVVWDNVAYRPDSAEAWEKAQPFARQKVVFKPDLEDVERGSLWEHRPGAWAGDFICRVASGLRGGMTVEEYMQAKGKILKGHKQRRRLAEQLPRLPGYHRELARMALPKVAAAGFGAPEYGGNAYRQLADYDEGIALRLVPDERRLGEIAAGAARLEEASQARERSLEDLKETPDCRRYGALIRREGRGELVTGDDGTFMRFFEAGDEYRLLTEFFKNLKMAAAAEKWE